MDADPIENRNSLIRLLRFLFWYAMAVVTALFILPRAALLIESYYETMGSVLRLAIVVGFVTAVAAWHLIRTRFPAD